MVVTLFALVEEVELVVVASVSVLVLVEVEVLETVPTHVETVMVHRGDKVYIKDLAQVLQHHLSLLVMLVMVLLLG